MGHSDGPPPVLEVAVLFIEPPESIRVAKDLDCIPEVDAVFREILLAFLPVPVEVHRVNYTAGPYKDQEAPAAAPGEHILDCACHLVTHPTPPHCLAR